MEKLLGKKEAILLGMKFRLENFSSKEEIKEAFIQLDPANKNQSTMYWHSGVCQCIRRACDYRERRAD